MFQDIDCVFEGFGGKGRIYISGMPAARNYSLLSSLNIKSIISLTSSGLLVDKPQEINNYLYIPAQDHQDYNINKHFKARKQANILVHCMAGISRSASIVIAYLMKKYQYSLSTILPLLKRKRSKINPNRGFIKQLENYSCQLGMKQSNYEVKKHKRVLSSLQYYRKEEQNIQPQKQDLQQKNKRVFQKKSTTMCEKNSKSTQKLKNIKSIDQKITILREKVMKFGKMRSKLNKKKNYEGTKLFSAQSQRLKPYSNQIQCKESKSSQLTSNNQFK